jgi:hypothetical protein
MLHGLLKLINFFVSSVRKLYCKKTKDQIIILGFDYATVSELRIHYHQFHLNPRYLSHSDNKLYRLSNFLVKEHEDAADGDTAALYRCHECFNVFSRPNNLLLHLAKHQEPGDSPPEVPVEAKEAVDKMVDHIEHLPREDFEDARPPRQRKKFLSKKRHTVTGLSTSLKRPRQKSRERRRHSAHIVATSGVNQNRPPLP